MMLLISILLALGLLAGIIYLLRMQRVRALNEAAEREQPLPPMASMLGVDSEGNPKDTPETGQEENLKAPIPETAPIATPPSAANASRIPPAEIISPNAGESAAATGKTAPDALPPAHTAGTARTEIMAKPGAGDSTDWKTECLRLRQAGEYEAALAQCDRGWPQWQSYQQSALIIRAALRDLLDKHTLKVDACPDSRRAIWLERLYTRAARASFLHDRVARLPDPNWQMLEKRFTQQQVAALPMRWRELGYKKLRLLNQSDCNALVELFGEPEKHRSARELHREHWQ